MNWVKKIVTYQLLLKWTEEWSNYWLQSSDIGSKWTLHVYVTVVKCQFGSIGKNDQIYQLLFRSLEEWSNKDLGVKWYWWQINIAGVFHSKLCESLSVWTHAENKDLLVYKSAEEWSNEALQSSDIAAKRTFQMYFTVGCVKFCQFGPIRKNCQIYQLGCSFGISITWFSPQVGQFLSSFKMQLVHFSHVFTQFI